MKTTGILIDPVTRTIETVDVIGDYTAIYPIIDVSTFTVVPFGIGLYEDSPECEDGEETDDGIYLDDEGLMKSGTKVWKAPSLYPQPLVGKGLIMGTDADGNSVAPEIDIETVRKAVQWTNLEVG
jgi:hypothetical protein